MKDKIISTTRDLFFKHGYKRTTMDEIANEAGVSKKTIYNHFKNKRVLLVYVIKKKYGEYYLQHGKDSL